MRPQWLFIGWLVTVTACAKGDADAIAPAATSTVAAKTVSPAEAQPSPDGEPARGLDPSKMTVDQVVANIAAIDPDAAPKTAIGGENDDPKMGLFALDEAGATEVDAKLGDLHAAYEHAERVAIKAWTGDRTFCEDAVRQNIGYYAVGGLLDEKELAYWKTATYAAVERKHLDAIVQRHEQMYDAHEPEVCKQTLRTFVQALNYVAREGLQIRNFGY